MKWPKRHQGISMRDKSKLKKFAENLPQFEIGTSRFSKGKNIVYLKRGCKERVLWHELGHAYIHHFCHPTIAKFQMFSSRLALLIYLVSIVTVCLVLTYLIGVPGWLSLMICGFSSIIYIILNRISESFANHYGRILRKELGPEIIMKIKETFPLDSVLYHKRRKRRSKKKGKTDTS